MLKISLSGQPHSRSSYGGMLLPRPLWKRTTSLKVPSLKMSFLGRLFWGLPPLGPLFLAFFRMKLLWTGLRLSSLRLPLSNSKLLTERQLLQVPLSQRYCWHLLKSFGFGIPWTALFLGLGDVSSALGASAPVYDNKIIAYVEEHVVTQHQIDTEIKVIEATEGRLLDPKAKEEMGKKILEKIIEKEIIIKEFERMKGQLAESHVQKKYDAIQKTHFAGNPLKLAEALRYRGKTKLSYKNELRQGIIVECMHEQNVLKPTIVSPREIQGYYDHHRSKLIQKKQFDIDQIRVKKENQEEIAQIIQCLNAPQSYEERYQSLLQIPKISIDRMDELAEDDIIAVVAEKIRKMAVHTFSDVPIEIGDQMLFLGLRNIREAHLLSINEAMRIIEHRLTEKKYRLLRQKWIDDLKKKAYYVIL